MAQADALAADAYSIPELDEQPEEEREAEDRLRKRNAAYPRPTQSDIEEFVDRQKRYWAPKHQDVVIERERRFMRIKTPEKWAKSLKDGRRFYSRLIYNEILAIVGAQIDNPPKVKIQAPGSRETDRKKARHESRFCQHLFPALERKAGVDGLRAMWVDGQAADGLVAYEVYLDSEAYEGIDTEPQLIVDPDTRRERYETDEEVMERTEGDMQQAPFPIGMRVTIADALFFDRDKHGKVCAAAIIENKPRPLIRENAKKRGYWDKIAVPAAYAQGVPEQGGHGQRSNSGGDGDDVTTVRYYDERWYAYLVDGKIVEGPVEHRLPGVPVFVGPGIITSSPNIEDRYQGVTAGLGSISDAIDDIVTYLIDEAHLTKAPKFIAEAEIGADIEYVEGTTTPARLDISGDTVLQLHPGQKLRNVMADHRPFIDLELVNHLLGFAAKNMLNGVAMGQSPGANAAGYTVSSLQDAAWTKYRTLIMTEARVLEQVIDFIRKMIRDTFKDRLWLSVPMEDDKEGGTEWLSLGPDDVTETPCTVTINPFTEQQQYQKRQSLIEGNQAGYVPRAMVMEAYGIEDTQAASDELILDASEQTLSQWAIEEAMVELRMRNAPAVGVGPDGMPVDTSGQLALPGMEQTGAIPADPNAPTVGAEMSAASQDPFADKGGPGGMSKQTAMAGSGNGYVPPNRKS